MAELDLSREERALFNPAFTALVCVRAVQGHETKYQSACPIPVAVTAAVMALQPSIRALLPATTRSGLMGWLDENESVRVAMGFNAAGLATVVRPGLLFGLQSGVLRLQSSGLTVQRRAVKAIGDVPGQYTAVQKSAQQLGRWLPSTGNTSTVLALLGVRP
ncbi:three component ABC system middle component [Nocardia salmonicida]|uniref:three component ABC system middle component n=1 Tax=Nocardia salmonicida TaxID=53431 RepID=UPI0007A4FC3E|nr:three component ABC system middle component [Nocardia salmonicida]